MPYILLCDGRDSGHLQQCYTHTFSDDPNALYRPKSQTDICLTATFPGQLG